MSDKDKHLCKLKDHIKENLQGYRELVAEARYVCLKCGRAARDENRLCKPAPIKTT